MVIVICMSMPHLISRHATNAEPLNDGDGPACVQPLGPGVAHNTT